jgi:adenosyl cobinamide kinase/adenosyl cobinamide phosphate guanylyltransferase
MVYATSDDCKSELGKKMQYMRADRPDEWTMDEFIFDVENMAEKIRKLEFMIENGLGYEDLERDI